MSDSQDMSIDLTMNAIRGLWRLALEAGSEVIPFVAIVIGLYDKLGPHVMDDERLREAAEELIKQGLSKIGKRCSVENWMLGFRSDEEARQAEIREMEMGGFYVENEAIICPRCSYGHETTLAELADEGLP